MDKIFRGMALVVLAGVTVGFGVCGAYCINVDWVAAIFPLIIACIFGWSTWGYYRRKEDIIGRTFWLITGVVLLSLIVVAIFSFLP